MKVVLSHTNRCPVCTREHTVTGFLGQYVEVTVTCPCGRKLTLIFDFREGS